MLRRVVLPAPEDPRMALTVPALHTPSTPLRIYLNPALVLTEYLMFLNVISTLRSSVVSGAIFPFELSELVIRMKY